MSAVDERFFSKVEKTEGCWLWRGCRNRGGYGSFRHQGRTQTAHRVSWEIANGSAVPDGMDLCHSCDNRACVRPDHLFVGTRADNMADCVAKGRQLRGELQPQAKLKNGQVLAIRDAVASGKSQAQVARDFGISQQQVSAIIHRENWGHVRGVDVEGLEPDAVRVVELIVERLRFGQREYGPLDLTTNPRDWRREASEELLDAIAYLAMETLKKSGG